MSVVVCDGGTHYIDSDDGTVVLWEPRIICEQHFEKLSPWEAWELALDAVRWEMGRTPMDKLEEVLKRLESI